MKGYASVSVPTRVVAVHPSDPESEFVSLIVGELGETKIHRISPKMARKLAKALIQNAKLSEAAKATRLAKEEQAK